MCFKPFTGVFRSFMGFSPKPHNSKLQDRAEDISFEEVKEDTKEQPKIDEKARTKQIADAVDARLSDLIKKNPMAGLMYLTSFITGANWADEHPQSNYDDRTAWIAAQHEEVQKLLNGSSISKKKLSLRSYPVRDIRRRRNVGKREPCSNALMNYEFAPTINEIVYNRPTPAEPRDFTFSTGAGLFLVGDIVRFFFGSIIRSGRITNSFRRGITQFYHIEGEGHVWYRGIDEANIISKLNDNE